MRKIVTALLLSAALYSCSTPEYSITGNLGMAPGDSLYVKDVYHNDSVLAAGVVAADGSFLLKGRITEPAIAQLYNRHDQMVYPDIFVEPGEIRIVMREQGGYKAAGTPLNDSLNSFNDRVGAIQERYRSLILSQQNPDLIPNILASTAEGVVDKNTGNLLGIWLFKTHEYPRFSRDSAGVAGARARLEKFTPGIQAHPLAKRMFSELEAIENTSIGKPYLPLSLPTPSGQQVALSDLIGPGRWVLIDFWATWCGPCMDELSYLTDAYEQFKDKGFEIYAVSLDNDLAQWQQVITDKNLNWVHVMGVGPDKKSQAARSYGIRSIPSNLLISPEGTIVAKNLRGDALKKKLKEIIG